MKKVLAIILSSSIALTAMAQKTLYQTKSLSNDVIKNVEAKTSGGSIEIAGGYSSDARIEVYVSSNGNNITLSQDEIKTRLDENYELSVKVESNKLIAIAKTKHNNMNWRKSLNISFKIFVPQNVSTDLSTSGGHIEISNLTGTEEFRTSGGHLTVDKLSGKINGETSGGHITVSNSKDDIDLGTSGGSIHADNCSGKIRLNTSGGSVTMTDLKGDVKATTSGGSVNGKNIDGELVASTSGGHVDLTDLSGSLNASTSGGSINVEMNSVKDYVKLNNSGGNIDIRIPKDKGYDLNLYGDKVRTETLSNFSGSTKERELIGKVNGGGASISADASGGKVYLSFK